MHLFFVYVDGNNFAQRNSNQARSSENFMVVLKKGSTDMPLQEILQQGEHHYYDLVSFMYLNINKFH